MELIMTNYMILFLYSLEDSRKFAREKEMFVESAMFGEGACRVGDFPCLRILLSMSPGHRSFLAFVGQSLILTSEAVEAGTPSLAAHAIIQRLKKKRKKKEREEETVCAVCFAHRHYARTRARSAN